MVLRRSIGRYDNVLAGPSADAEIQTGRLPRMIPMIRSSPEGKGWELVYPRTPAPEGHVTAGGRTRTLEACAADPSARADGDLAVFPLPDGAVGGIELGSLFVRFREQEEAAAEPIAPTRTDEPGATAFGVAIVALALVGLLAMPRGAVPPPALAVASPEPSPAATVALAARTPSATPAATAETAGRATAAETALAAAATTTSTPRAPAATPAPLAAATPAGTAAPTARPAATPAATASPARTAVAIATGAPSPTAEATPARPVPTPSKTRSLEALESGDPLALGVSSPRPRATAPPAAAPTPTPTPAVLDDPGSTGDAPEAAGAGGARSAAVAIALADGRGVTGRISDAVIADAPLAVKDGGHGTLPVVDVGSAVSRHVKVASTAKAETPLDFDFEAGTPDVRGTLDPAIVQRIVGDAAGGFRQCYDQALRRNLRITGTATLRWTIVRDGGVSEVSVGASTLGDEQMERCLTTRVRRLRFPRPAGGTVKVEYPFRFQASLEPG